MAHMLQDLAKHGYCLIDCTSIHNVMLDSAEVINGWFKLSSKEQKRMAGTDALIGGTATEGGRGYFRMSAQEVLELRGGWKSPSLPVELRLAANATLALRCCARNIMESIFSDPAIMSGTKEQLQEVLGVQLLSSSTPIGNLLPASSSSTVLHVNRCSPVMAPGHCWSPPVGDTRGTHPQLLDSRETASSHAQSAAPAAAVVRQRHQPGCLCASSFMLQQKLFYHLLPLPQNQLTPFRHGFRFPGLFKQLMKSLMPHTHRYMPRDRAIVLSSNGYCQLHLQQQTQSSA